MKFGKFFARNAVPQSASHEGPDSTEHVAPRVYVPYEQLQKLIPCRAGTSMNEDVYKRCVEMLDNALLQIEAHYQTRMGTLKRTAKSIATRPVGDEQSLKDVYEQCNTLVQDLSALKFYASLNAVAICKICKKFDKNTQGSMGPNTLDTMVARYEKKMRQLQFCDSAAFHRFNSTVNTLMKDIEESMIRCGMSPLRYRSNIDQDTMQQLSSMMQHDKEESDQSGRASHITMFLLVPFALIVVLLFIQHISWVAVLSFLSVIVVFCLAFFVHAIRQAAGPSSGSVRYAADPYVQTINPLTISQLLLLLPTNIISRIWGIVHSVKLPQFARKPLFMLWTIVFGVNLHEMRHPLESYESLGDFFSRPLKDNMRTIDREVDTPDTFVFNSPVDGRVVSLGEVNIDEETGEATLDQIKGLSYSLNEFLGKSRAELLADMRPDCDGRRKRLYQIVIYLAPGDYHRIHSPIDWKINRRTHFPGCLLPVNPVWVKYVRGLFAMNERVVLEGEYVRKPVGSSSSKSNNNNNKPAHDEDNTENHRVTMDKFYMVAVGALNVGSIALTFETEVKTNNRWQLPIGSTYPTMKEKLRCMNEKICKHHLDLEDPYGVGTSYDRIYPDGISIETGEEVALFQLGSTVVLVFEMSDNEDLFSEVVVGDKVRVGQKLFTSRVRNEESNEQH